MKISTASVADILHIPVCGLANVPRVTRRGRLAAPGGFYALILIAVIMGVAFTLATPRSAAQPLIGNSDSSPAVLQFPSASIPPTGFAVTRAPETEAPARLVGRLYVPPPGQGHSTRPTPALVLLPGCLGTVEPASEIQLATRFTTAGIAILLVESLPSRYLHPQCLWDDGQVDRLADAIGALDALVARPGIDPGRIAVLGFGRAGNAALAAIAADGYPARLSRHRFAAAIAYYPRCSPAHSDLAAPGLIVIGAADETSPVAWCRSLPTRATAVGPGAPEYLELPGAGHGFDLAGASDPAGRGWGQPDPVYMEEADATAHAAVIRFLDRVFGR